MRTILELLRIIAIFGCLGGLGWVVVGSIYTSNHITDAYSWLGALAILILFFILYRNKFQFFGWYQGKNMKKLPKNVSVTLIFISITLFILPFILSPLFH